jgi:hypothetical protein
VDATVVRQLGASHPPPVCVMNGGSSEAAGPGPLEGELEFTLDPYETAVCDNRATFFKKNPLDGDIDAEVKKPVVLSWRLKERMKTMSVALVACLNIRVDPPDVIKPSPVPRSEKSSLG